MVIIRRVIITITITAPNRNLLSLSWSYLSGEPFKLGRLAVGVRIVPLLEKLCTLVRMILIHVLFFFFFNLFLAVLGLHFCARAFSSCGERGPLFIAVRGPLTIAASLVAEHRLQTRRLSSCGSQAQLLRGTWDLPRPGLEPVSPALAGRFSTTAPPGKLPLSLISQNNQPK